MTDIMTGIRADRARMRTARARSGLLTMTSTITATIQGIPRVVRLADRMTKRGIVLRTPVGRAAHIRMNIPAALHLQAAGNAQNRCSKRTHAMRKAGDRSSSASSYCSCSTSHWQSASTVAALHMMLRRPPIRRKPPRHLKRVKRPLNQTTRKVFPA